MSRLREWSGRRWGSFRRRSVFLAELLDRLVRYVLVVLGIPIKKTFLVLRCAEGSDVSGLFSEFAAVLGALEHYERWQKIYSGLKVDFADQGLYYEPVLGNNWWQYYFEPISLGCGTKATTRIVSNFQHDVFAYRIARLSRRRGFALIDRYIRPNPHISELVDLYVRDNFGDAFVIGVHYRGTDKWMNAPRVQYAEVLTAIRQTAALAEGRPYKVFVATDEEAFLDYIVAQYPGRLLYREMFRSRDGQPIDVANRDGNYKKGEDAVIDCLVLSRCHHLVRTASNLSLCSILFNPDVPDISLNRER